MNVCGQVFLMFTPVTPVYRFQYCLEIFACIFDLALIEFIFFLFKMELYKDTVFFVGNAAFAVFQGQFYFTLPGGLS